MAVGCEKVLQTEPHTNAAKKDRDPEMREWESYQFTETPGHYYTSEDLTPIRDEYLRCGREPRQLMKDYITIKKSSVRVDGGSIVIHSVPENWGDISRFLDEANKDLGARGRIPLPYMGRGDAQHHHASPSADPEAR